MKITTVELFIFPLENVHCGYGIQQGAVLPSLPYIPGRVIRGGLAGWAVRNRGLDDTDPLFERLFFQDAKDNSISFPWCTCKGRHPAPFSLFEARQQAVSPLASLIDVPGVIGINTSEPLRDEDNDFPVDFLKRDYWPPKMSRVFKPFRGTVNDDGYECFAPFSTGLEMKSAHDADLGRVKEKGSGGLRIEEVMVASEIRSPEKQFYSGILTFREDSQIHDLLQLLWQHEHYLPDDAELEDILPANLIFIGRKKIPAAVYASQPQTLTGPFLDDNKKLEELTVTLTTDCIFELTQDNQYRMGKHLLANELHLPLDKVKRAFCRSNRLHGFDTQTYTKKTWPTIAAGSCLYFSLPAGREEEYKRSIEKLWQQSLLGVGKHGRDGCGRFKLNWEIHNKNGGTAGE